MLNNLFLGIYFLFLASCSPVLNTKLSNPILTLDNNSSPSSKNIFIEFHNITGLSQFNIHDSLIKFAKSKGYNIVKNSSKSDYILKITLSNYKYKKYNLLTKIITSPALLLASGYAITAKLLNASTSVLIAGTALSAGYGLSLNKEESTKSSCCDNFMSITANIVALSKQKNPITIKTLINNKNYNSNSSIHSNMIVNYNNNSNSKYTDISIEDSNIYFEKQSFFRKKQSTLYIQANGFFLLKKKAITSLLEAIKNSLSGLL